MIGGSCGGGGGPGPKGDKGDDGIAQPLRFDFSTAATWTANHNLGRIPFVSAYLANGEEILADVNATISQVVLTHGAPVAGFLLCI
jgi:hypothetical protein